MTIIEQRPQARPADPAGLADLLARRTPGMTLEAPFYTDPAIFEADLEAVWARTWLFVATEAEVREPGDYVTVDVGPRSVVIVRDDDEEVQALLNVCRHRGARLLEERSGSVGNIVCGYHQWTYAPDGTLLHAGDQPPTFDKGCFSLKRIPVRVVGGLVFVCFSPEPPPDFDDVASRIAPYLAPHGLARTKVAAQVDLVEQANWKLVMENNRECYHCEGGHPELIRTFFPTYGYAADQVPARMRAAHDRYLQAEADLRSVCTSRDLPFELIEEIEARVSAFRIAREALDGAGESYTLDGSSASQRLLGDLDVRRLGRLSLHTQPNAWAHFLADHAVTFSVLPIDVDHTLVRTTWLVAEDAEEGVDYDLDDLTKVWQVTNAQDAALCAKAQRGVSTPGYEPGPYSASEYQVDAFVSWYVDRMREALGMTALGTTVPA